jgi:RNA polymerase sigma-70 factor (TIGR02957 family)
MTDRERLLDELRPVAFAIAYRMLGSVSDAEDVVQEALLRTHQTLDAGETIASPRAFVATVTTRLAINELASARARREAYVGTWLPEPIVTDLHENPEEMAELSESLSMAFLVLLERLSPVERAVFLLREVFAYPYEDIAKIVDKGEANCRQIFGRARQHVGTDQARYEASTQRSEDLLHSFLAAARDGDLDQLVQLLAADAVFSGDGGGKAYAVGQPLYGRDRVAAFVLALFQRVKQEGVTVEPIRVNGGPGIITRDTQLRIVSVLSLEVVEGVIQTVRGVTNPDKLGHLGAVSDMNRRRAHRLDREPEKDEADALRE